MRKRLLLQTLDWIEPRENPAGVVYGIITIATLLAAESGAHETYLDAVASALIALLLYWLAHSYSHLLGQRIATQQRLSAAMLWQTFVHDWAIVRGAAVPLVALLLCWAAGASQQSAVDIALASAITSLIGFEVLAGVRSQMTPRELGLDAGVGTVLGLAILALRVLLH